jgi:membrane-associated phospholipid phosphatase
MFLSCGITKLPSLPSLPSSAPVHVKTMSHRLAAFVIGAAAVLTTCAGRADEVAPEEAGPHFRIDPIADLTVTAAFGGAAALTGLILSTGEIVPQHASADNAKKVLPFDRVAINQTIDPNANTYSTIGLGLAVGFAIADPLITGYRDGWRSGLVDATMYAESLAITSFITSLTKIAVRRPRPIDYKNAAAMTPGTDTDAVLSFFSGHAATTAAVAATATYVAFVRSPQKARPWITLGIGTLLTAFVSYERVRSGAHFPTDVIAGSLAGAAIGVVVPHVHRDRTERANLWFGLAPAPGGGRLTVGKVF